MAGMASQRLFHTARGLAAAGHDVHVVTPREGPYPRDASLVSASTSGVAVYRTRAIDPVAWHRRLQGAMRGGVTPTTASHGRQIRASKLRRFLRTWALLPDGAAGWIPFAVAAAIPLTRQAGAVLVSSSPPLSSHVAAWLVRSRTGAAWLADVRDPAESGYGPDHDSPSRAALDRAIEAALLRSADAIVTVSHGWQDLYRQRLGASGPPVCVVTNGFDPADFAALPRPAAGGPLILSHTGRLYAGERDFRPLLAALERLLARGLVRPEEIRLRFACGDEAAVGALAPILRTCVQFEPFREHRADVLAVQGASHVLLLHAWTTDDAIGRGAIPGKIFEYLAASRPVLAIAHHGSDVERIVNVTRCGVVCAPSDVEGMAALVADWTRRHRDGEDLPYMPDADAIRAYTHERRLAPLLELVGELAGRRADGRARDMPSPPAAT
jgi:glycosyltransferase involved in cell wall biosynthesis